MNEMGKSTWSDPVKSAAARTRIPQGKFAGTGVWCRIPMSWLKNPSESLACFHSSLTEVHSIASIDNPEFACIVLRYDGIIHSVLGYS